MSSADPPPGPDLRIGVLEGELADGAVIVGHVGDEAVLLTRRGDELFAIDATCSHYGGPLGEGLIVGETVRCPWHHACFSLRTGEALAAPAFAALSCWRIERGGGRVRVGERAPPATKVRQAQARSPARFVIIGGGAAGFAAAETLRREGYDGDLTILSGDDDAPYDRPNLSKDYLAGSASEDWIPLRPPEFYDEGQIDLRLGTPAVAIDAVGHRVTLASGEALAFDKLLIATGAEPIRLSAPGAERPHVRTLRSLDDCRQIIERAGTGARVVVVGASFIGLEAAAALRSRVAETHVVAPESRPMEQVLGAAVGDFLRSLHEAHGVTFHLGRTVQAIADDRVRLDDGVWIEADLVVVGVGVRPRLELAEKAGLAIDRGVLVDEYLRTSAADIYAAGDIARWPDPHGGEHLRVEHWVVAQRQGQTAGRNMLGRRERYAVPPFFWTQHYDVAINYVGHAAAWDDVVASGDPAARDLELRYRMAGRTLAVATISRDRENLAAELAMERGVEP